MAHINVHRIEDIALRRIARTAQIEALPPQPERRRQPAWGLNRRPWAHATRGGRPIGSFGPLTPALALLFARAQRAGVPQLKIDEQIARLSEIAPADWTAEDLAALLPPAEEEVIPDLLEALRTPEGFTPLSWQQLLLPIGGIGTEEPTLLTAGSTTVNIYNTTALPPGGRYADVRRANTPPNVHLTSLSYTIAWTGIGTSGAGTAWVSCPQLGIYIPFDAFVQNGIPHGLTIPIEADHTEGVQLEIGVDIVNPNGATPDNHISLTAAILYRPIR